MNTIFIRSGKFYKIGLFKSFGKLTGKHLYHQACNFTKKRPQHWRFTVNFAKLWNSTKALCRTPPVSVSNFSSTFLTLRPHKTYIYVFTALLLMFLIEARNKSVWCYTKFSVKQALFSAAQQTSTGKLPEFFSKILNQSEHSKG